MRTAHGTKCHDARAKKLKEPMEPNRSSNRAAPSTSIANPLAGHHDESTAYVVPDYPYGFRLRTQIRYWTEAVPKKGVRFVSQTMDPKTGRWNKPKKSTFARFATAMYLDENGHVQTKTLSEYSKASEFADYLRVFGLEGAIMPDVRDFTAAKVRLKEGLASGKVFFTINKEPRPENEYEKTQHAAEAEEWRAVLGMMG